MELSTFKGNLNGIVILNLLMLCALLFFWPTKANADPFESLKHVISKPSLVDFNDYHLQMKPAGAKAAQAAAQGTVVSDKPSLFVATAVTAGSFVASVRGDGGGTAGGLEKLLNQPGK